MSSRTLTLPDLKPAATVIHDMRVITINQTGNLLLRIRKLERELADVQRQQVERVQREARIDAITIHVVDRRTEWYAKCGLRNSPRITITTERATIE